MNRQIVCVPAIFAELSEKPDTPTLVIHRQVPKRIWPR